MGHQYSNDWNGSRTLSPELALNLSAEASRSQINHHKAYDAAHARLAQEFAAVGETSRRARFDKQQKLRDHSAGANHTLLSLGWYLGAARMKKRAHSTPPKPLHAGEEDHFWSIEAPIIALALIHEFGSEAHTRASHRADGALRAGDVVAARQWRRIAQIIRHEQATTTALRASTPSSQSGSPQRSLGRWRASPPSLGTGGKFSEA
jgi:hypothetical protein